MKSVGVYLEDRILPACALHIIVCLLFLFEHKVYFNEQTGKHPFLTSWKDQYGYPRYRLATVEKGLPQLIILSYL